MQNYIYFKVYFSGDGSERYYRSLSTAKTVAKSRIRKSCSCLGFFLINDLYSQIYGILPSYRSELLYTFDANEI